MLKQPKIISKIKVSDVLKLGQMYVAMEWGKGNEVCGTEASCVSTATLKAARDYDPERYLTLDDYADGFLRLVTGEENLVEWNDAAERTQTQVLDAFTVAIALAEQQGK